MLVFRKQIDNLKTNHRVCLTPPPSSPLSHSQSYTQPELMELQKGVYVLTDNSFRPFARMSTEAGGQAVAKAQPVSSRYSPSAFSQIIPFSYQHSPPPRTTRRRALTLPHFQFLWFPCGVIRGALASMGINATVQAESSELPGATFQIKSTVTKP